VEVSALEGYVQAENFRVRSIWFLLFFLVFGDFLWVKGGLFDDITLASL
jgi:hypothetical protein